MESLLYVSLIDWNYIFQRPQHLATELSRNYKVEYVYEKSLFKWWTEQKSKQFTVSNLPIELRRTLVLPLGRFRIIEELNMWLLKNYIKHVLSQKTYGVLWLTHPKYVDVIPESYTGKIIYDCMDYHAGFHSDRPKKARIESQEKRLCDRADLIFTSSRFLYDRVKAYCASDKVCYIPNAADFAHFSKASLPSKDSNLKIGYFGTVAAWFDFDLLSYAAKQLPDTEFEMIGPIEVDGIRERFQHQTNVSFIGKVNFEQLPDYLKDFDVCIMPFKVNKLIKAVDPVKIYEYLAAGKPVVSVYYKELDRFEDFVYTANTFEDFVNMLRRAIQEDSIEKVQRRTEFAAQNTWKQRAEEIIHCMMRVNK